MVGLLWIIEIISNRDKIDIVKHFVEWLDKVEVVKMGESYKTTDKNDEIMIGKHDKIPIIYRLYFFCMGMIFLYPLMIVIENFIAIPVFVKIPIYIIAGAHFKYLVIFMVNKFILKHLQLDEFDE